MAIVCPTSGSGVKYDPPGNCGRIFRVILSVLVAVIVN